MRVLIIYFFLLIISVKGISAQTDGELVVSVTTSSAGGEYAPRNIFAIWISKEDGQFVKTLMAYANKRKTHLNTWQASTASAGSEFNSVDAITGATLSSHAERSCKWNGTDHTGAAVPDGNYFVQMELTDKNSTGNTASFLFTKSESAEELTPEGKPSFSSVNLNWVPATNVSIKKISSRMDYVVFPNPSTGIYHVTGGNLISLEVRDLSGKLTKRNYGHRIDISDHEKGIYLLHIISGESTIIKKIIKH